MMFSTYQQKSTRQFGSLNHTAPNGGQPQSELTFQYATGALRLPTGEVSNGLCSSHNVALRCWRLCAAPVARGKLSLSLSLSLSLPVYDVRHGACGHVAICVDCGSRMQMCECVSIVLGVIMDSVCFTVVGHLGRV